MVSNERAGWPTVPGYVLHEVLGRGGFATVYRATQESVDRSVALKVLASGALDPTTERRFGHEVRAVGALSDHPHVVALIDAGTTAEGSPFISMQLVPDGSMGDRVRTEGPLPPHDVARIGSEVADALEAAHDAGILHRDIKPDNILVGHRGRSLLTDFGIATLDGGTMTATGTITGTIAYTPPEVIKGARPTTATDVFALGATLYTLLAGRLAFSQSGDEHVATVIYRVTTEDPPPLPPSVPPALADLVMACLVKDPEVRPSLPEVRERLESLPGATPTTSGEAATVVAPAAPVIGAPPPRRATASVPVQPVDGAPVGRETAPSGPPADAPTEVQGPAAAAAAPVAPADAATQVQRPAAADPATPPPGVDPAEGATQVQAPTPAPADAQFGPIDVRASAPRPPAADRPPPPPAGAPAAPPAQGSPPGAPPTARSGRAKLPLVVAGAVVVLVMVAGAALLLTRGGDDDGGGSAGSPGTSAGPAGTFAVGTNPIAVTRVGDDLWVANRDDGTVVRVAEDGTVGDPVSVDAGPSFLADGDGSLWVVSSDSATLSRVDPGSGEVLVNAGIGDVPGSIAAGDTGVWVVNTGDLDVARIDYGTNEYAEDFGPLPPGTSQVAATGEGAWVATAGDDGSNQVVRLDGQAQQLGVVSLEDAPAGIGATDDAVYVALAYSGTVLRLDPGSDDVAARIEVDSTELGPIVVVDGQAWVADLAGNQILRLDGDRVVETVAVGVRPGAFTVTDGDVWTVVPEEGAVRRDPR